MTEAAEDVDVSELEEIERIAVELATLAGAEIQAALGSMIAVRYKGESPEKTLWRDPVSEIDQRVETLIRGRVGTIPRTRCHRRGNGRAPGTSA